MTTYLLVDRRGEQATTARNDRPANETGEDQPETR